MSEKSEAPEKPQEPEIPVPESSGETGKSLKRNYCYVCEVQCTALKNFLDHQKGKRHLKKLKLKEDKEKKQTREKIANSSKKIANSSKKNLRSSNSLEPYAENSKKSELPGDHNSDNKGMSNSKRLSSKFKGNHYNSNNQNNYSRHRNSKYSYFNQYENDQGYFYNERPKSAYSSWKAAHYQNSPHTSNFDDYGIAPDNQHYSDRRYNVHFQNDYYAGNGDVNCISDDYVNERSYLPFSSGEPENSVYNFLRNEMPEVQQVESNFSPSENANKSSAKDKSSFRHVSETSNSMQISVINSDKSCASKTKDNKYVNSSHSSQILNSNNLKIDEIKRHQTRSVSSAENINNDKKLKDKNENLSADLESTPEEQKLKEYTTSLLDNPHRISLMIQHPSSHKEKAVLNHIMTSFSKSKRKENLTRKLRSNSLGSVENNDDATLDIQSVSSENDDVSILTSEVICVQTNKDSNQSKCPPSLKRNGNNSEECYLNPNLNNKNSSLTSSPQLLLGYQSSKKSGKVNVKSKENSSSTLTKKTPQRRKEKSLGDIYPTKRKNCDGDTNKAKKQRSCNERNPSSSMSRKAEQKDLNKNMSPVVNPLNHSSNIQITTVSHNETAHIKEDVTDYTDLIPVASVIETPEAVSNQIMDYNSQFSVETLIELFASGNVAVKREFNDPVIDAIKEVDPNELISACSNDSHMNNISGTTHVTVESNTGKPKSPISVPNFSVQQNTNCINPVILGSTVDSDIITPVSIAQRPVLAPSPAPTEIADQPNSIPMYESSDKDKDSLSEIEKLNLIGKVKSEFPHFITLIEKLQEIACKEETIKENISEAKLKINEYSNLLEEWKNKKKKLHDEEEELRKKRNDIIQLMQNTVNIPRDTSRDKNKLEFVPEVHSTPEKSKGEQSTVETTNNTEMSSASTSSIMSDVQPKPSCSDSDEILILPSPVKPEPPEILIIDDAEESSTRTRSNRNSLPSREITPNFPNQGSSLLNAKNLTAHSTVVNCLVVFDDFVYTCSNDNSAKRFNLKDTSQTVTYLHAAKNVTEIVVEIVQNEALVFTSCSHRILSLFIASNGTKIKTFFQSSNAKSICKGWGKFYAGMEDGTVNMYNWKFEEKEFVKTPHPVSRIATVHQGGLHILIILTTDGHVSLRDAKTSLLIRFIKTSVKFPAWLTVHNDFVYLSSSDRTVSVLDIQSGKIERKWQLGHNHSTGLAVCDDHFFTISYSGVICCVNKENFSDVTLFYGAGKTGLTCIHVYQNWVFTGNRKGDISVFQFDPCSKFSCKILKCRSVFGSVEDLAFHFELQHLKKKNLALCQWGKCPFIFPVNFSTNDKINHLKKHILPAPRGSAM